jgi:hypothetical protein
MDPERLGRVTRTAIGRRTFLRATGLSVAAMAGATEVLAGMRPGRSAGAALAQADEDPIAALAAELAYDRDAIFRFVADEIEYEPYAGSLRGPRATLAGRAGNAVDKALLLASLLAESFIDTRLVMGALPEEAAQPLGRRTADPSAVRARRASALASGRRVSPDGPMPEEIRAVAERLPEIDAATTSWAAATLDTSAGLIVAALAEAGITLPTDTGPLPDAERDHHVWVQARSGPEWIDLDATLAGAQPGSTMTTPDGEPLAALPDDLRHRIDIAVVVERIAGDALVQEAIIEHTLFAEELAGVSITLGHAKPQGLQAVGVTLLQALEGGIRYQAVLQVGETSYIGTSSLLVSRGEGGVLDVGGPASRDGEATAEWLDIVITAPGGRATNVRRTLFDRIGATTRQAGSVDPTTIPEVELPALGADGSPEFPPLCAVHCISVATGHSQRPVVPVAAAGGAPTAAALGIPAAMYHLARDTMNTVLTLERGAAVHLDAANITMDSYVPSVGPDGSVRVRRSLDLLHRGFATLPVEGRATSVPAGVLAGVASHVAERLRMGEGMPADLAVTPPPASPGSVVELAAIDGTGLRVLQGEVPTDLEAAPEAIARLRAALADGWVAVGPRHPVVIDGVARLGWWLVDPSTGATTDLSDDGRGAAMVEWAAVVVLVAIAAVVAIHCVGSAANAAAWNAWVAEMQGAAGQLGADVGDLPTKEGACG